jgi:tRNA uridine 5-carbamoylmethylation protein Kti12
MMNQTIQDTTKRYKILQVGTKILPNDTRYYKSVRYETIQESISRYGTRRYKIVQVGTVPDDTKYYYPTIQDSTSRYGTRRYKRIPNETR